MRTALPRLAAAGLAAGAFLLSGTAAAADEAAADSVPPAPTTANVQRFLDKRVPGLLEEYNLPGAAVSVVANGEQVYAGGYGEADVEKDAPVDAGRTSFPMASVSKSFTAVAVLQLAEQGKVDLRTDVNEYLPERMHLPDTYPGDPVTLHHLLTHTAGFEDMIVGMAASAPEEMLSLTQFMERYRPDRVYPPGTFVVYSNYGIALAGMIVQEASGTPFEDYVQQHVFAPLSMDRSTLATPREAGDRLDTPTLYGASPDTPVSPTHLNATPAGGGYATATDMSNFMLAVLNGGRFDGHRVLSAESAASMLKRQESVHPELTGPGYGTWDRERYRERVLGHSGAVSGAHTDWTIAPESGFGVFVAVNGDGRAKNTLQDGRARITDAVLTEFVGAAEVPDRPAADIPLERYEGTYTLTRHSRSDVSQAVVIQDQTTVSATGDGRLHTSNPLLGERDWTPVEKNLFRSDEGDQMAFLEEDGKIIGLALDRIPHQNYELLAVYRQPNLHFAGAGIALLTMCTVSVWPLAAIVRRVRGRRAEGTGWERTARVLAAVAVVICLGFTGFIVSVLGDSALLSNLMSDGSPLLTAPLTAAGAVAVPVAAAACAAWVRGWWGLAGRIHYTLVTLAVVGFVAFGVYYGMTLLPV